MAAYLERYRNGECEQVWADLLSLKGQIRQESLYSEALAVTRETMSRVRTNVELLVQRLEVLGYKFKREYFPQPLVPITQSELNDLDELESQTGPLPLSLRIFFEKVGTVDFSGYHLKLSTYVPQEADRNIYSDPLVVYADVDYDPEHYNNPYFEAEKADKSNYDDRKQKSNYPYVLNISGDPITKAGYGGGFYSIYFPDPAIDGYIFGANCYFVEYLRKSLHWGGFPGIRGNPNSEEELKFLTEGLLPI